MASALFVSDFACRRGSDEAPFIWAALSLYWAQMASLIPEKRAPNTANSASSARCAARCRSPASCKSAPLRGCAICTATCAKLEWHVVRVKCSNCEQSRDLHYWSLDNEQAAVKAESCSDCGTYLRRLCIGRRIRKSKPSPTIWPPWCSTPAWNRRGFAEAQLTRSCSPAKGSKFCSA